MVRWLAVFVLVGCAGAPDPPRRPGKPQAPLELRLTARSVGDGLYEVSFEGRALADLDSLSLELALPAGAVLDGGQRALSSGRTVQGGARLLLTRVRAPAGTQVVGLARSPAGDRGAALHLGAVAEKAATARATHVVMTPFGPVAESR